MTCLDYFNRQKGSAGKWNLSRKINFPDPGEESPIEDLDDLQEADYDIQEDDFDQIPGSTYLDGISGCVNRSLHTYIE